jgi:hypothetical protein
MCASQHQISEDRPWVCWTYIPAHRRGLHLRLLAGLLQVPGANLISQHSRYQVGIGQLHLLDLASSKYPELVSLKAVLLQR